MTAPWQLWVLWGLFIGVGTGAMALVLGAIVANRWFSSHRGLVTGLFSAANATGQLSFLPVIAALAEGPGWRWAAGSVALVSLALVPLVLALMADRPADLGLQPYGEPEIALDTPLVSAAAEHPPAASDLDEAGPRGDRGAVRTTFDALALGAALAVLGADGVVLRVRLVDERADADAFHSRDGRLRHEHDSPRCCWR